MRNKVYILGAGCSARYGCPTAKNMASGLEAFGQKLGGEAAKIKKCVAETVELMRNNRVETVDDLSARLHAGALDGVPEVPVVLQNRQDKIWRAKVALAAFLLLRESEALESGLAGYRNLLSEICPDAGIGNWQQRLRASSYAVLTFNYDRFLEIAFLIGNGSFTDGKLLYGDSYLNSGFSSIFDDQITFNDDGFCFLKLHGCVGRIASVEGFSPSYRSLFGNIHPGEKVEIVDGKFFPDASSKANFRKHPLLVFPHEKQHVRAGGQHLIYKNYVDRVWKKAERLVAESDEIWIIGYSFHALDRSSLINLLSKASRCERIVIQNVNGEANRICHEMKIKHSELKFMWEPFEREF